MNVNFTIMKDKVNDQEYRLANFGYSQGWKIQASYDDGRRYYTILDLGWVNEKYARLSFNHLMKVIETTGSHKEKIY